MMKWYFKKISRLSGKQIVVTIESMIVAIPIIIIFLLFPMVKYFDNSLLVFSLTILGMYLFFFYMSFIFNRYYVVTRIIFLEDIDLQKYIDINDTLTSKGINKFVRREAKETLKLNKAQVLYLKGDFKKSLEMLETFDTNNFSNKIKAYYGDIANYYKLACRLQLKDFNDIDSEIDLLNNNKEKLQACLKLARGESTSFFDNWSPKWKLEKMSKWYYAALNHLNQNQPEEAKACFQEIVNENPELFYVKEAKKYLEELA